jgi:hypothetical protein
MSRPPTKTQACLARASRRARCVRGIVSLCVTAFAGSANGQEAVNTGLRAPKLSGSVEVAVANRYVYHGYVVEDRGPVVQPYLCLAAEFYSGDGALSSASAILGVFNSLQFHHAGISAQNEMLRTWYEAQIEAGVSLTFAEALTLTAQYVRLESPNGAFVAGNAVTLGLELDDERWLGAFALRPRFLWFTPVLAQPDLEDEKGHYFEVGVAPGATIGKQPAYAASVSFPITVGFGDHHYFLGERFGFVSAGVAVSVPLAFIPKGFGSWSISGSALHYRLGRVAAGFTSGGERDKTVFAATLATQF